MCIYAYLPRPNMYAHMYIVHAWCFVYDGLVVKNRVKEGEWSETNHGKWLSKQPTCTGYNS